MIVSTHPVKNAQHVFPHLKSRTTSKITRRFKCENVEKHLLKTYCKWGNRSEPDKKRFFNLFLAHHFQKIKKRGVEIAVLVKRHYIQSIATKRSPGVDNRVVGVNLNKSDVKKLVNCSVYVLQGSSR